MNPSVVFEIVELALSLTKNQTGGKVQQDATLADTLVQIIAKSIQAYKDQAGQPVDPTLIKAEAPL